MSDETVNGPRRVLRPQDAYYRKAIYREGDVVHKESSPWTPAVHSLLRHLEAVGFDEAPKVVGTGFDFDGYETFTFIEGEFVQPGPWTEEGAFAVGSLLQRVHRATASFVPPDEAQWRPWHGRRLGSSPRIIGHCDVGPWNIVVRHDLPVALIDWDYAGPVDPLVELAEACWLNAKLHDDIVAEREGLPPLSERVKHLRAIVDGYGLDAKRRTGLVDLMIEFAVSSTAAEANESNIMPDTDLANVHPDVLWAMAWRARAAAYMQRNRKTLASALS